MRFSKKTMLKLLLEKCFIIDKDYKKLAPPVGGTKNLALQVGRARNIAFPHGKAKEISLNQ
tara:strand:+ start:102 stop:284 length:183 start_codon:yes stop_codon:yes gene_type:complete